MINSAIEQKKIRVLVTGANGFVGKALCAELCKRGFFVRAAMRTSSCLCQSAERVTIGILDGQTDWAAALMDIDVVIHLAARAHIMHDKAKDPLTEFRRVNTAGTERLGQSAAECGVKRLVYVSSIKVNGEETTEGQSYSEQDEPAPCDPYGVSKWEAEKILRRISQETNLEIVIVRPPLVYGKGVKGNFAQMLTAVFHRIPLPLASVNNRRDLIYVDNLVDALMTCATHPAAANKTYLVSDGESVSTPGLLGQLALAMKVSSHLFPFPPTLIRLAGKLLGKSAQVERLLGSLQVDSGRIRRELNWVPPYTLQQGLRATALSYQTHKAI